MTATKPLDLPLPLINIKKEKDERMSEGESDECDDDEEDDDNESISSLLQPSILDNDCFSKADPKDEFLHLTSLVRRVYFSYLHKSIVNNYNVCCTPIKNKKITRAELKKCASLLELNAVRASLATSLYRQAMLKIISDIKSCTSQRKIHNKLVIFLDTPPKTVDAAVQTSFDINSVEETYLNMQNNTESLFNTEIQQLNGDSKFDKNLVEIFDKNAMEVNIKNDDGTCLENSLISEEDKFDKKNKVELEEMEDVDMETSFKDEDVDALDDHHVDDDIYQELDDCLDDDNDNRSYANITNEDNNISTNVQDIFGEEEEQNPVQNEDQESRDSLMEHLENMFGESDDSSDIMTLIERHSGVTKTNVDKEITKMCSNAPSSSPSTSNVFSSNPKPTISTNVTPKIEPKEPNTTADQQQQQSVTKRKLSFSNYKKKMRKRAVDEAGSSSSQTETDTKEDRLMKKKKGIWFVERVHQVAKLQNKMMELSIRNYRKHGRVRKKFEELFGDSEEEEMMPESPIHIEEHLTACKERIAPWVVKYLMPYYSKKIIQDRLLFKAVGKHVTDMLIIKNTFPEEECVSQFIKDYFKNKPSIKSEADIYV